MVTAIHPGLGFVATSGFVLYHFRYMQPAILKLETSWLSGKSSDAGDRVAMTE
tara:strand:- start:974 stop:1132 length:159 start_codon:yes stop_codon:yes gene_type:complete